MSEKSESKLGWLAKYGVPSLALSVAVFVFQQQQQVFDRVQRITADGWQFYSNGRSELQYSGDVEDELALLKVIGYAFPNIFCDVRRDIYERAWSAEPPEPVLVTTASATAPASGAATLTTLTAVPGKAPDGRRYIQQSQLDGLRVALEARGKSNRPDQPGNLIEAWFPEKEAQPCPALDTAAGAAPARAPAAAAAASGGQASPGAATPADTKDVKAAEAAPPPPPPPPSPSSTASQAKPETASGAGAPRSSAGPVETAPASPPPAIVQAPAQVIAPPKQDMKSASRELHVYFHIRDTGVRDESVAEGSRMVLSAYNYRVIRKVARLPADRGFPTEPEIRYFGPDQKRDAEQLAEYLAYQFQAEGLKFRFREIGKDFPKMNPQNIEVWLPDPK